MDAEGDLPSVRGAKLAALTAQLEQIIAQLDRLGFGRIALPVGEAIELAKAHLTLLRDGPTDREATE